MKSLAITLALLLAAPLASAQDREVSIDATQLADGVWMLTGQGGNMLLVGGEGGSFLVDDQFAPLTEKIQAKIAELGVPAVEFVLNTHFHGDHTGGNENLGAAGAIVVAQEGVRERLQLTFSDEVFDRVVEAVAAGALPTITYGDAINFYRYGHDVHAFHVPHAHTDGDSFVHLPDVNVLEMSDVFFNGLYPFIDVSAGGSLDGVLAGIDRALELSDADTKIVPGHGPLGDREALIRYRDMLLDVRAQIRAALDAGKSLEEIQAMKPTAKYDDAWGKAWLSGEQFTKIVVLSETRKP